MHAYFPWCIHWASGLPEGNEPLQEVHLKTLVEFLNPVASRWEDIGIQLGVNPRDLDTLKKRGCPTVDAALSQVLKRLESLEPLRTVDDLVAALSSSSVAEKVYAEHLRNKYGNGLFDVGIECSHIWYICVLHI